MSDADLKRRRRSTKALPTAAAATAASDAARSPSAERASTGAKRQARAAAKRQASDPLRVCIVGVGLMGGLVGRALRAHPGYGPITGLVRRSEATVDPAILQCVDHATDDPAQALRGQDIVLVAVVPEAIKPVLRQVAEYAGPGTVITDLASIKQPVLKAAERTLPRSMPFVGSHPMAGSEQHGASAAVVAHDLLRGRMCVICEGQAPAAAVAMIERLWADVGMSTHRLDPREHDRVVAQVSHCPHLVAAALMNVIEPASLPFSGTGLYDTTRVAGGEAALWRQIVQGNAKAVRSQLRRFQKEVKALIRCVDNEDWDRLEALLSSAAAGQRTLAALRRSPRQSTPEQPTPEQDDRHTAAH